MDIGHLLFGVIMLLAGRRLFWLFVGIIGFMVGMEYGATLFQGSDPLIVLVGSIVVGILMAVLAVFAEWIVILVAGFVGGGYLFTILNQHLMLFTDSPWIMATIGGVVGLIVMLLAFDIALVFISSFLGAALIVQSLGVKELTNSSLIFIVLAVVGVVIQSSMSETKPTATTSS